MDASELTKEGVYGTFGATGARMEMPGCSLCMATRRRSAKAPPRCRPRPATSRNRLGRNTNVYLGSAELAAICSRLGRIPTKDGAMADIGVINANGAEIYRYMNFDQIEEYQDVAKTVAA